MFLLDEIDKMSTDFRGDPAAALLEVLDPEQNHDFNDHYLDLDYDLSDVMFITHGEHAAADPGPAAGPHGDHPAPRLHRVREAHHRGAVPDAEADARRTGSTDVDVDFTEDAVRDVIHHYTKEAGVRTLEREIASVCRKVAREVVAEGAAARQRRRHEVRIAPSACRKYLGVPKYRLGTAEESATRSAW